MDILGKGSNVKSTRMVKKTPILRVLPPGAALIQQKKNQAEKESKLKEKQREKRKEKRDLAKKLSGKNIQKDKENVFEEAMKLKTDEDITPPQTEDKGIIF